MKLQRNLPTNGDFFDRYAELITSLSSVATIAQIITGACEIGILYGLIYPSFVDIAPPQYVGTISMIGAIICAALLQIGLKKVYPHAVRAILHKHFQGLYLWFSIFIFILTLAMLTASITLSWQGSKDIADFAVSKPIEKTTLRSDSTKNADFLTAQRLFTSDSATIETKYKGKLEAIESDKMNEINVVERNAKGKQATSLRAELKTKLAKLQADKAAEIEAKANDRKKSMDRATDRNEGDAATVATDNTTSKNEVATKKSRYKGYIGYFTLMCYVFFLSVFTMNEIYHKGANIEIKPLPSQRHFNPSVFAEFIETVKEKLDVFFRTKIQNWADNTPPQPLPLSMSALYDFKADVLTDTIKIETTGKETKVVKLPLKVHKIAAISKEDNQLTQRQIGFRKDDNTKGDTAEKEAVRNAYNATNMSISNTTKYTILNCAFEPCGQPFERRTTFQKYCCEEHRIAAFESRTGRQLKKQAKK
jgi:phage anti-repressor protein